MKDSKEFNKPQIAKTIAFVHNKGGTGKTTSCLNIAGWLVKINKISRNLSITFLKPLSYKGVKGGGEE